jgi:hypothetical protein
MRASIVGNAFRSVSTPRLLYYIIETAKPQPWPALRSLKRALRSLETKGIVVADPLADDDDLDPGCRHWHLAKGQYTRRRAEMRKAVENPSAS